MNYLQPLRAWLEEWSITNRHFSRATLERKFSAQGAIFELIRKDHPEIASMAEPELEWKDPACFIRASSWQRPLTKSEAKPSNVIRAFDRSGSYLSAWSSAELPAGEWTRIRHGVPCGMAGILLPGYYLIRPPRRGTGPAITARAGSQTARKIWVTRETVDVLIALLGSVHVYEGYQATEVVRPLDKVAADLSRARRLLAENPAALARLKAGYAAAVAWFEFGPKGGQLHRPAWRRTLIERFWANTWRSLRKMHPRPFAVMDVDTALFSTPPNHPLIGGMRSGTELGAWKPKGRGVFVGDHLGLFPPRTDMIVLPELLRAISGR